MKKYFIFLVCLASCLLSTRASYSQDTVSVSSRKSHELNFIFDDIFAKPTPSHDSSVDDYASGPTYYPRVGLGFKWKYDHSALRTRLYFGSSHTTTNITVNDYKATYSNISSQFNLGYEWHHDFNKLQLLYGADLLVTWHGITSRNSSFYNSASYHSEYKLHMNGFGISPFIGFEYFLNPRLSLSSEINFSIETYKGNDQMSSQNSQGTEHNLKGTNTRIGPIGNLGLNVHF